jgi:hypothetical protein
MTLENTIRRSREGAISILHRHVILPWLKITLKIASFFAIIMLLNFRSTFICIYIDIISFFLV